MTALRHPYIEPALVIEVEDVRVPEFTEAGWLTHEPTDNPDPDGDAEGPDSPEEEK